MEKAEKTIGILNMGTFQKETDLHIVKVTLTLFDRRSGDIEDKTFYRPDGINHPDKKIEDYLMSYGYDVIGYKDEDFVEGIVDWESIFNGFKSLEQAAA